MSARAQDDGARVYQFAPEGFQIFTAFVVNKRGNEGPDPGQTTFGSETRSDVFVMRYARTFLISSPAGQFHALRDPSDG